MKLPGAKRLFRALTASAPPSQGKGPDEEQRAKSSTHVIAEAYDESGKLLARADLKAANGYEVTAGTLTWTADMIIKGKFQGKGALGPREAFGPQNLVDGCKKAGLELSVIKYQTRYFQLV